MTIRPISVSALALLLAACAAPPPEPPRTQQEAITLNQSARLAFERGDFTRAGQLYEQALAADTSIENADGIAMNALSLAQVHQKQGDSEKAQRDLDLVLNDSALAISRERRAEAAARKAQIALAANDTQTADQWADTGLGFCAGSCPVQAALLNLHARAALARNDSAGAIEWAAKAQSAAGDERGRAERANALRITAEARIAAGDQRAAIPSLNEALALDKTLALPPRIYSDLMLLGRAHAGIGEREAARGYFLRALAVANALKDVEGARDAQAALDKE
ncbi:MAG TPA: tetratricopeptide repeat protein [Burkholderiales bacterium]|nr:tetratricopeptide repeat protein [Burkholderiales bacterium]